jgi:hypothetical protein
MLQVTMYRVTAQLQMLLLAQLLGHLVQRIPLLQLKLAVGFSFG